MHETVPSPLSVDKVALDSPLIEISILEAIIVPLYVACKPLAEPASIDVIVVPDIFTIPEFVAQIELTPFALFVITPPVILTSPPLTKTTAFTP